MGTYNRANVSMKCPRCEQTLVHEVALYLGDTSQMVEVKLGAVYPLSRTAPAEDSVELGEGYVECESCNRDFFCIAEVLGGRLHSIEPDLSRTAYVPDAEGEGPLCPHCGAPTLVQRFTYRHRKHRRCMRTGCDFEQFDVAG